MTIPLDEYEVANLRAGLQTLRALHLDMGDWIGQILNKLPATVMLPNRPAMLQVEETKRRWEVENAARAEQLEKALREADDAIVRFLDDERDDRYLMDARAALAAASPELDFMERVEKAREAVEQGPDYVIAYLLDVPVEEVRSVAATPPGTTKEES
jgi:hypothetical protein